MFYKILTVAALATFEMYAAIPAGYAFRLAPWIIFLASLVGGLIGVFVAGFLGDKIKAFIIKKRGIKNPKQKKNDFVHRIWEKYGIIGLGLFGTFTVGAPISIAVGLSFNASLRKLLTWCCIGVLSRALIFTFIGHMGNKIITS